MKQTFVFEYEYNIPFTADEIMGELSLDGLTVTEITEPEKQDKCYGEDATCKFNHTPVICESCNRYYGDSYRPKD
jgi:hypothetical protein